LIFTFNIVVPTSIQIKESHGTLGMGAISASRRFSQSFCTDVADLLP